MIAVIDNYDSFVHNLCQYLGVLDGDVRVFRNNEVTVEELRALAPDALVLSPGPGRPADAGCCEEVVRELGAEVPLLGVCLGHQAVVEAFGGRVGYARRLMHGKQSETRLDASCPLFSGLPERTPVARYHSLAADPDALPACLRTVAETEDGEVMAVQHRELPVLGLQFHPESVLTPEGMRMIENFVRFARGTPTEQGSTKHESEQNNEDERRHDA